MMHTTWSVRTCFERADALAEQAADLRPLLGGGPLFEAIGLLLDQQRELIVHLARNLRGGCAVPATPAPAEPRKGMRPVTHTRARPVDTPAAEPPAATGPLLTRDQARRLIGYSAPGFDKARTEGHVPPPHCFDGRAPLWRREQIEGIKPRTRGPKARQELAA